jgi:hypothetical protein
VAFFNSAIENLTVLLSGDELKILSPKSKAYRLGQARYKFTERLCGFNVFIRVRQEDIRVFGSGLAGIVIYSWHVHLDSAFGLFSLQSSALPVATSLCKQRVSEEA